MLSSGRRIVAGTPDLQYPRLHDCLLYTSDAADERSSVDLGGRRIIKKKKNSDIYVVSRISKDIGRYTDVIEYTHEKQQKKE